MNPKDRLMDAAANGGDIDSIYKLIQEDPQVLEKFDENPFDITPLHAAASSGNIGFATEIMRLKPSLAWKLNRQGLSPIHLAMEDGDTRMVYRFVEINNVLVRVKGKGGQTPLHFASKTPQKIELLTNFLWACPDSFKDVTVKSETALHIAVGQQNYAALRVLVGWLRRNCDDGSKLENRILNWKDDAGNTILHTAASNNDTEAVRILVRTGMNLNAKNIAGRTAFDEARNEETMNILSGARARAGSLVADAPTIEENLTANIGFLYKNFIWMLRIRSLVRDEQRGALMVVATLIVTAIYQSALNPPAGVFQANAGDNNVSFTMQQNIGTSIVPANIKFIIFWTFDMFLLFYSIITICILLPGGVVSCTLFLAIAIFVGSFFFYMSLISPFHLAKFYNFFEIITFLCGCFWLSLEISRCYHRYMRYADKREIRIRNNAETNIW